MEKLIRVKEQYRKTRVVVVIKTKDEINRIVKEIQKTIDFSGVVLVKRKDLIYEKQWVTQTKVNV